MSTAAVGAGIPLTILLGTGALGAAVVAGAVIVTAATVAGASYVGYKGAVAGARVLSKGVAAAGRAAERRRIENENQRRIDEQRRLEEHRKLLTQAAEALTSDLSAQVGALGDAGTKRSLEASLRQTLSSCRSEIQRGGTAIDEAFREIRYKLLDAKMEESMANSLASDFESLASRVEANMLPGFRGEWEKMLASAKETSNLPTEQRTRALRSLIAGANEFAGRMGKAAGISLEGIVEDVFIVPSPAKRPGVPDPAEEIETARADIADFGGRIAFFDRGEAESLRPLMEEAVSCASPFRLSLIRDQIKTTYGKLKERRVLAELFKQELRELLPVMKRTRNSESLIFRMEELLEAGEVRRDDFSPLYREAKTVIAEQIERLIDDEMARRVEGVLGEMGYSLLTEDGREAETSLAELRPGEVRHLETPYEGYRVRVRVDGGKIATRLVRVAASEAEKAGDEYQRQKDEETGKKWCGDLDAFYGALEKEGVLVEQLLRKEPGDEPLDVIVEAKGASRKRRVSAGVSAPRERRRA